MPHHTIDPHTTSVIEPPTKLSELTAGLLLFFARPSPLQSWAEFFGHEWRHVGVTVRTPDGLMIASYGPRKCFRLDNPYEIMGAYDRVGVARVFDTDVDVEAVEAFCRRFEHLERSDAPYTFASILVGPIHLMARRRAPGVLRSTMLAMVHLFCRLQNIRYRDRNGFVCSTFVWSMLDAVLDRPLRVPLSAHPDDVAAYATPSTARDELFARWLCGPTELWHAISETSRAELDLSSIERSESVETMVEPEWIEEVSSSGTSTRAPAGSSTSQPIPV